MLINLLRDKPTLTDSDLRQNDWVNEMFPRPFGERVRGKKAAFTLAEVLITLGIIGVVAAMAIPNLITAHQKRVTVTKLQKAISILNQAYRRSYDDVGEANLDEAMAMGANAYFEKYWAPYLKTSRICETYDKCGYKSNYYKLMNGNQDTVGISWVNHRLPIYTMDGMFYDIFVSGGSNVTSTGLIFVDINGAAPPNTFGKDVFVLERVIDGEKGGVVLPYCSKYTNTLVNKGCSASSGGWCCAEKIKRAGWVIDKSYPWK